MTLRIKIEVIPHGDETRGYEIHRVDINNIGYMGHYAHDDRCAYQVIDIPLDGARAAMLQEIFVHRRSWGAIALARRVLERIDSLSPQMDYLVKKDKVNGKAKDDTV